MSFDELIQKIKDRLQALYGERLRGLILYGSEARGDARPDSDIDILALLDGPVETREIRNINGAVFPLRLEFERPFHVMPGDFAHYEEGAYCFYRLARKEGIALL